MADNIGYTPGTGASVAADLIGGDLYQRVKISVGADGAATDVSSAAPMPVEVLDSNGISLVYVDVGAKLDAILTAFTTGTYETVAAGQSGQVLGGTGAIGDWLERVVVQPTTTSPGVVTVLDNAVEVQAYPGGTVGADLTPFVIEIGANSVSGAWKITTGSNVKATAYGTFT